MDERMRMKEIELALKNAVYLDTGSKERGPIVAFHRDDITYLLNCIQCIPELEEELVQCVIHNKRQNMETKLAPCPFCGAPAFFWKSRDGYKVSCNNDCITMPPRFDMWFGSEEQAAEKWNIRKKGT